MTRSVCRLFRSSLEWRSTKLPDDMNVSSSNNLEIGYLEDGEQAGRLVPTVIQIILLAVRGPLAHKQSHTAA